MIIQLSLDLEEIQHLQQALTLYAVKLKKEGKVEELKKVGKIRKSITKQKLETPLAEVEESED